MNKVLGLVVMCMSSLFLIGCEKDGNKGEGGETAPAYYFEAKVQMSEDFINACESITFEYKDAEGEKVSAVVDASKLKPAKYENEFSGIKIDVLEWYCKVNFKNSSADIYFKPTIKLKESVSFTEDADFMIHPMIYSGKNPGYFKSHYDNATLRLGVDPEAATSILSSILTRINNIEVVATFDE